MVNSSIVAASWACVSFAVVSLAVSATAQTSRTALVPGTTVITDVGLIPMTSDTLIQGATVLIRDGRIAAVARDRGVKVPAGARRIDGRGKYLIPGLADMHVHLYSDDETPDSLAGDELGVMLANGVTAIRLMIGTPEHLVLRGKIEIGRMLGPQLWVASPQLIGKPDINSRVVTNPDQATAAVKEVADLGYDFVKLTTAITPPVCPRTATPSVAGCARRAPTRFRWKRGRCTRLSTAWSGRGGSRPSGAPLSWGARRASIA